MLGEAGRSIIIPRILLKQYTSRPEFLEVFQWSTFQEVSSWGNDPSKIQSSREELADILIY